MPRASRWILILAIAFVQPAGAEDESRWGKDTRRLAQPLIEGGVVPCVVIGLYDAGHTEVHGFGSLGKDMKPDGSTIFEIGSLTKVFTGVLLADMSHRKRVALDDPIGKFMPRGKKAPAFEKQQITLEHLATHRSTLPRMPTNWKADDLRDPYALYDDAKLLEFLGQHTLTAPPGTTYGYSNLGMGLLGNLLGRVEKTPYPELVVRRICKPLGMKDTGVLLTRKQARRVAPPHRDGVRVQPWNFDSLCACGGLRSTADDMLRFIEAQVSPASSKLADAIPLALVRKTDNMALGWFIARDNHTYFHHGQTGGYSSGLYVSPKSGKGIVVLSNGASGTVDVLAERVIQMLYGMQVEPPEVRKRVEVAEKDLRKLVGDYDSALGFTITVTIKEGGLFARLTNQAAIRVFPESPTRFFYQDIEAELRFTFGKNKTKAESVTLLQNGREMLCTRKPGT